ncbi:MAG: YciI family protein [Geminicoccaceae bacterium]
MRYAILCYHDEASVGALTKKQDDALMVDLAVVREELIAEGKLGPVARLMPTTASMTLRAGAEPLVMDGPFAETKEALLGFYVVDCATLEDAIEVARRLLVPRTAAGLASALEIRPISIFHPGGGAT